MTNEDNAYSFTTKATRRAKLTGLGADGFPMRRGGRLAEVTIAYESWGKLSPDADNAILIFTGLLLVHTRPPRTKTRHQDGGST
jgi:homoserine acetyltransferase